MLFIRYFVITQHLSSIQIEFRVNRDDKHLDYDNREDLSIYWIFICISFCEIQIYRKNSYITFRF